MNKFDLMRDAVQEANATMRAADMMAKKIGYLIIGRLRKLDDHTLCSLKKELKNYNMHTGEWKDG